MSYKTFGSMNIAIIGAGRFTEDFATSYALVGHEVFIAWKSTLADTAKPTMKICDNINICSIEEAAGIADIIVISSLPKDVREIAYWLGDVRGKVIIDATANLSIAADEHVNTYGAIKAITGSSYIVKMFCTRGYEQLLKPLLKKDGAQWVVVGDSKKAKEVTKILAKDMSVSGFTDLGNREAIPLFDAMTKCWRDLGKNQYKEKSSAK
jgi:predicted dinucleotide-binding enzyme